MAIPFIKFPGGKRDHAVVALLADILRSAPYHTYAEVMVGAGGPFFGLQAAGVCPLNVLLNDADVELMQLYAALRSDMTPVLARAQMERDTLTALAPSLRKPAYYALRDRWDAGERSPGLQLFLRWACFNGLFRRNSKGFMNTPCSDKLRKVPLPNIAKLTAVSSVLQGHWLNVSADQMYSASVPVQRARPTRSLRLRDGVEAEPKSFGGRAAVTLLDWDFRELEQAVFFGPGTLVYVDPPFDKSFNMYVAAGFTPVDQLELIEQCARWSRAGATVVYSNHTTPLIEVGLVDRWRSAVRFPVFAKRTIAADPLCRDPAPELIAADNLPALGTWGR